MFLTERAAAPVEPAMRGWNAELELGFERRGDRCVLASRRHEGPLAVQKTFHPEGADICHALVLHPPAGIAGGDRLGITVQVRERANALLATPGAGKWYRSAGARARQHIRFEVGADACLEWLPQETIVFDGALADMLIDVRLAAGARYLGWEVLCLGRTGSGERFTRGEACLRTRIERGSVPLFNERGRIEGGSALLESPAGLAGQPVCGTLLAVSPACDAALVAACRDVVPATGEGGVTLLPGVLVARYLGASSEAAKNYFVRLWRLLRPVVTGREAADLRIWRT